MASTAPITAAPTDELNFKINGADHLTDATAGHYIESAHAVAYLGQAATHRHVPLDDRMLRGCFETIQLLLAHAFQIHEERA